MLCLPDVTPVAGGQDQLGQSFSVADANAARSSLIQKLLEAVKNGSRFRNTDKSAPRGGIA